MADTSQTIKVDAAAALEGAYHALSESDGGTILLESGEDPYSARLRGGGNGPVTIRSEEPDERATLSRLNIEHAENITVEGIAFNSVGTEHENSENIRIAASENIEVRDVAFRSDASDYNVTQENKDEVEPGGRVGGISSSHDVSFVDNTITNYQWGLGIFESTDIEVSGNEFAKIQADGIRMAGVQDVRITDNHFHDFLGWPGNHDDMIQVWGTDADLLTRDLTIEGNILDSGDGVANHGILIRNEDEDGLYEGVTIADNLVRNGHSHGIYVEDVDGAVVEDNTLLWNRDSMLRSNGEDVSWRPEITVIDAENSTARNNIFSGFWDIDADVAREGNEVVNYTDPNAENYVERHFVDAAKGGAASLESLRLQQDSPWNGTGASVTQAQSGDQATRDDFPLLSAAAGDWRSADAETDADTFVFDAEVKGQSGSREIEVEESLRFLQNEPSEDNGRFDHPDVRPIAEDALELASPTIPEADALL